MYWCTDVHSSPSNPSVRITVILSFVHTELSSAVWLHTHGLWDQFTLGDLVLKTFAAAIPLNSKPLGDESLVCRSAEEKKKDIKYLKKNVQFKCKKKSCANIVQYKTLDWLTFSLVVATLNRFKTLTRHLFVPTNFAFFFFFTLYCKLKLWCVHSWKT